MVGGERGVLQLVFRERGLLRGLIALRNRGRVRIRGLFELRRRDQVFFGLRLIAIELLLRIHQGVLGGGKLRLRARGVLLRVRRIEPGDDLPVLHHIAEAHAPLDDLAADAKR